MVNITWIMVSILLTTVWICDYLQRLGKTFRSGFGSRRDDAWVMTQQCDTKAMQDFRAGTTGGLHNVSLGCASSQLKPKLTQ